MGLMKIFRQYREFLQNKYAGMPQTIIMILVVILIFSSVFGLIALNLDNLGKNTSVAAIPGSTAVLGVMGLCILIVLLFFIIKKMRG